MPADRFELEADRIAESVMRMPDPRTAPSEPAAGPVRVRRVQDEAGSPRVGDVTLDARAVAALGSGQPLSTDLRDFFEPRFGHSFSTVRVHSGPAAGRAARSIDALAFTIGPNIAFADGQYRPATVDGRRLVAHELAHVLQQGEASAHTGVQRACGAAIGSSVCPTVSGEPAGERVLFHVNCDDFLSAAERGRVTAFADSMAADDTVTVHGFASMEGAAGFNVRLSCARANRVADLLRARGVPAGHVTVLSHGPQPGVAALRRSVVMERTPAVSRPTVPQLSATVVTGPAPGGCGGMDFVVRWGLSRPASRVGGFVVQDITFTWDVRDCAGVPIPVHDPRRSPVHYFEAWRVGPGAKAPAPFATDTFHWLDHPPVGGGCTNGTATIEATATYHDNVAAGALPPHVVAHNPLTFAHDLPSSVTDPALGGNESRPVAHRLRFHWTCCPCSTSRTVVDAHAP